MLTKMFASFFHCTFPSYKYQLPLYCGLLLRVISEKPEMSLDLISLLSRRNYKDIKGIAF